MSHVPTSHAISDLRAGLGERFEPAFREAPSRPERAGGAGERLPFPVAARIIAASSLGLWFVAWKVVASLIGS